MLGHRSNLKNFFDEIVGYYLPDNHFLYVNDIIDWTPVEKGLKIHTILQREDRVIHPSSCLRPCFCSSGSTFLTEICRKPSQTGCLLKAFLGLSLSDPVLSDTTFCRFRQKLQEEDLLEELFSLLDGQLEDLGILVKRFLHRYNYCLSSKKASFKRGKEIREICDTSFTGNVEGERQNEDEGFIGITKNGKIYYKSDPGARWTVKRGKFSCGYKVHVNTDESGIVRRLEMTPANVHDSSKLRDLINEKDTKESVTASFLRSTYSYNPSSSFIF